MSAPEAHVLAVQLVRTRARGLRVDVRYTFNGKRPTKKQRDRLAADLLREALQLLDAGDLDEVGFRENSLQRIRSDELEGSR